MPDCEMEIAIARLEMVRDHAEVDIAVIGVGEASVPGMTSAAISRVRRAQMLNGWRLIRSHASPKTFNALDCIRANSL